jgi:hypothetical protein
MEEQNVLINQIIQLRSQYLAIDKVFEDEVHEHARRNRTCCNLLRLFNI